MASAPRTFPNLRPRVGRMIQRLQKRHVVSGVAPEGFRGHIEQVPVEAGISATLAPAVFDPLAGRAEKGQETVIQGDAAAMAIIELVGYEEDLGEDTEDTEADES